MDPSSRLACVTLDLENNWDPEDPDLDYLTFEYLDEYFALISELDLPVSVFTEGRLFETHPGVVRTFEEELDCEFHLHSYRHSLDREFPFEEEVDLGRRAYEEYFGDEPEGYRAPLGDITDSELQYLDQQGFAFDSSVFPTYRPGMFNNFDKPTEPFLPAGCENLIEIPFAVTRRLRIPIAQSYLKLLGRPYLSVLKRIDLPEILVFDSHLQDFFYTDAHETLSQPLRSIHKRNIGNSMTIFRTIISLLKERGYQFVTISEVYDRVTA